MNLIPALDDHHNAIFHRRVSEDGSVWLGVYPVLFGHRVRAGYAQDRYGCVLDWCGGGDWADVERLYSIALAILSQRTPERAFDGLPRYSEIKPFYMDHNFTLTLLGLAGDTLQHISLGR